ncbi:hypothetical protein CHS0354_009659, partial [Potamilus streckersoni]
MQTPEKCLRLGKPEPIKVADGACSLSSPLPPTLRLMNFMASLAKSPSEILE